ncbi:MAG TPA: HEPN domain-containing protein [Terriglobia bacterium]|nr:HEPN domain-containing protein [Terriglobia bacterium]
MKDKAELVQGWLRKAASDVVSMEATLQAGSLDGACFHAQQAAEKYLKGYLSWHDRPFPHTHNLSDLIQSCAGIDATFSSLAPAAAELTPYAVRLRYDDSFWPPHDVAAHACESARTVRDFVLGRLPHDLVKSF